MKADNCLAIIPARGSSKRIPRKNVRPFLGRPMIEWPLQIALTSGLFEHVVVSTDDEEIAECARSAGAETPFVRPADIADDHTPLRPVINHAIEASEKAFGTTFDTVCCILATAVFVQETDLSAGRGLLDDPEVDFAFSAATFPSPVQRALVMDANGGMEMLYPQHRFTRSQDLPPAYHDVGQFYWGRSSAFLDEKPMYSPRSRIVQIPESRCRDIDTPDDWSHAELLMKAMNG